MQRDAEDNLRERAVGRPILRTCAGRWASTCVLVGLVVASCVPRAWGEKRSEDISPSEPAEAYFALVRGDTARENGQFVAALAAYQDALARYERIAQVHPDWESDIVQYRIVYCRQQIEQMRKKLSAGPPQSSEQAAPEIAAAGSSEELEELARPDPVEAPREQPIADDMAQRESSTHQPSLVEEEALPETVLAADQESEYLRNRIAELLQQVNDLEEALEKLTETGDAEQWREELEETRKRAEAAETKARELEEEVRRLSRALAERAGPTWTSGQSEDAQYVSMLHEALKRERARDVRGALALYEQARKKKGSDTRAVLGQARCLVALGQLDRALALLEKQENADNNSDMVVLRAAAQGMLGHYERVVSLLEPLARRGVTDPWVYNLLGAAWLATGRYEQAREALEKAIELSPEFAEPYYNLAVWFATATNDLEKARAYYNKSIELGGLNHPEFERLP